MQNEREGQPVEKYGASFPGAFASQEEFDEARRNLERFLATLKEWKRGTARGLVVKSEGCRDLASPSLN